MLLAPAFTTTTPHTYEQIGHRVQRILADPKRQKTQSVTVARLPDELPADWRRLMNEIGDTAGIRIDELDDDAVLITWKEYCEA